MRVTVRSLARFAAILPLVLTLIPTSASAQGEAPAPADDSDAATQPTDGAVEEPAPDPQQQTQAPSTGGLTSAEKEAIRNELRQELTEEIRESLREELREDLSAEIEEKLAAQPAVEGWEEEWEATDEAPELNFLELHGYFRLRPDLFYNFNLGNNLIRTSAGKAPFFPESLNGDKTIAGANMRFRLNPTLNISDDIKLKSQIDILDNYLLGSTPEGFGSRSPFIPLVAFSQTQLPGNAGVTAVQDTIAVKRVWAEVLTPVGQLRFGRMGSHWGLGLLANDGNCLDCDFGDSPDRIMFVTKIADHYIVPAWDFVSEGYTSADIATDNLSQRGQPFDLEQTDDVNQYILAVAKRDKDEDVRRMLENDEVVFNYGTYQVFRVQSRDVRGGYRGGYFAQVGQFRDAGGTLQPYGNTPITDGVGDNRQFRTDDINDQENPELCGRSGRGSCLVERNARAWIPDIWLKLMWRKLRVEAEAVVIYGQIKDISDLNGEPSPYKLDILQWGWVLQADYKLLHDSLTVGVEFGMASGDDAQGFGVFPGKPTFGLQSPPPNDHSIDNFRFNPDYIVDMIFWRQIVGTVTDAFYFKPSVQYNVTEGIGARLDLIYSRTLEGFQIDPETQKLIKERDLGVEMDLDLFYRSDDGFHAGVAYGVFFPLAGLDNVLNNNKSAGIAHTVQGRFVVTY